MSYIEQYNPSEKEQELLTRFNGVLDELYADVDVAGYTWSASYALEQMDLIAYRTEFLSWLDAEGIDLDSIDDESDDDDSEDED